MTNSENNLNTGIAGLLHLILERRPHRKEKGGREEMKCGWEPNPHGDVRWSDPTPGTPGTRDYSPSYLSLKTSVPLGAFKISSLNSRRDIRQ